MACITVAADWLSISASWMPSAATSSLTRITRPPTASGRNSSNTEMSKVNVVTASKRSSGPIPGWCCIAFKKFTTLRCSSWTPLGLPVDPEVKIT